jgi:phosphocarrier protein
MVSQNVRVENKLGLHARAAARLVRLAAGFSSEVWLRRAGDRDGEEEEVDCKSILAVLMLAAAQGTQLVLTARGADEVEAGEAVARLFADRFGEEE